MALTVQPQKNIGMILVGTIFSKKMMNKTESKINNLDRRRAFTIIELLLYIALVSVLLLSLSAFWANTIQSRIKTQTISEVDEVGTQAMNLITQSIRNADSVTTPAVGTSGAGLTLTMATAGVNPTVFDLSSGVIRVTEGATPAVNIISDKLAITNLSFQNLSGVGSPGVVRVSFTVTYKNTSGRNEYDYSKTFYNTASVRKK